MYSQQHKLYKSAITQGQALCLPKPLEVSFSNIKHITLRSLIY